MDTHVHTHTRPPLWLWTSPCTCYAFREQIASAKVPPKIMLKLKQTRVTKPRNLQCYTNIFLISIYIVPLPCTLNYGHWLQIAPLVFMHVFQVLYQILNAGYYMHIHKTSEALCSQQWCRKGSHNGWVRGTHIQHCSAGSLWTLHGPVSYAGMWFRGQPTPTPKTRIYFWKPSWPSALGSEWTCNQFWTFSGTTSPAEDSRGRESQWTPLPPILLFGRFREHKIPRWGSVVEIWRYVGI